MPRKDLQRGLRRRKRWSSPQGELRDGEQRLVWGGKHSNLQNIAF
jgi:hypothetical protein